MAPLMVVCVGLAVIDLGWIAYRFWRGDRDGRLLLWTLIPTGWAIPLCLLAFSNGRRLLRKDLSGSAVIRTRTRILRAPLAKDFESDQPEEDQYLMLQGRGGRFVIPLAFWRQMFESQEGECEYFQHSRVVFRINGQGVWEPRQAGVTPNGGPAKPARHSEVTEGQPSGS